MSKKENVAMMPEPIDLNIGNICEGAVPELFDREIREVLENIADVSTDPEAKRSIILQFDFKPAPDRRSAVVAVVCKSKQASVEVKAGTIFFAKRSGKLQAFAEDPRQDFLFNREPPASPERQ